MITSHGYFDLGELFAKLWRRKWLVVLPLVLTTAAAVAGSYVISPTFESSVVIYMGNPVKLTTDLERMLGEFRDIIGSPRDRGQQLNDLKRELLSPPYLAQVIDKLSLDTAKVLEKDVRKMKALEPQLSESEIRIALVTSRLKDRVGVSFAGSNHLRISAEASTAHGARNLAQALGEVFVAEKARQEHRAMFLSVNFSHEQLARYDRELQQKVNEKTQLEKEVSQWQASDPLMSDASLSTLSAEIDRSIRETNDKKAEERKLLAGLERYALDLKLVESGTLRQKMQEVKDLVASLADLIPASGLTGAPTLGVNLKVGRLEDDIRTEMERLVAIQYEAADASVRKTLVQLFGVRERMDVLYEYVNALRLARGEIQRRMSLLPDYRAKLEQLEREVVAAQQLRDRFKAQRESYELSSALLEEARFQVVEPARVQSEPVWPKPAMLGMLAVAIGLLLGGSAVFLVEYMDRSLVSPEETAHYLQLPIVGIVPKSRNLERV